MNRSPRYTALATALALSLGIDPAATAGSLLVADADRPVHGQHAGDWQARANNLRRSSEPRVGGRANSDASVAMTRTVTSCADDGSTGTLRQVVAVAVSGDTIDLSARACTITLASAITIGVADLTIHGSGQGTLTIDGASKDRVLNHTVSGTLHVDNLAVTHGHIEAAGAADGRGGCIASYRYGGEVVLDHVKVTACSVHSAHYAYGGGVSAYAISLTNSTISGNTASGAAGARGGGALSYASTDLVDSMNVVATQLRSLYRLD